jgi:hypothetical protein
MFFPPAFKEKKELLANGYKNNRWPTVICFYYFYSEMQK